jgi:hypothetical protein
MSSRESIIENKVNETNDDEKNNNNNVSKFEMIDKPSNTSNTSNIIPGFPTIPNEPFLSNDQMINNMFNLHVNALTDDFSIFRDDPNIAPMFPYKIKFQDDWVATKYLNKIVWHLPFDDYDWALINLINKKKKTNPQVLFELLPICTEEERKRRFLNKVKTEMSKNGGGFIWESFKDCTTEKNQEKQFKKVLKELQKIKKVA